MAKELHWVCEYCDSMNKISDTECVNCGAPRTLESKYSSTPEPEQSTKESLDDMLDEAKQVKEIANEFAGILGTLAGNPINRLKYKIKRFFKTVFTVILIIAIVLIVLIVFKIMN